ALGNDTTNPRKWSCHAEQRKASVERMSRSPEQREGETSAFSLFSTATADPSLRSEPALGLTKGDSSG
ncbi:MAG: hypothetical protein ACREV2_19660, partial [Burkholderiales bacterium]